MSGVKREKGFTLVEMVVVIAILGILSAIAVPLVTNYLSTSKDQAYDAEVRMIQAAVDSYYSGPGNIRFTGKRQYPIIGRGQTDQVALNASTTPVTLLDTGDPFTAQDHDGAAGTSAIELWNPIAGTDGIAVATMTVAWTDGDTDGVRDIDAASPDTWDSVVVTRGGKTYHTDPRYFFIDFEELLNEDIIEAIPESASESNKPVNSTTTYTGSYIWYVDDKGKVQSLYYEDPDTNGFVSDVFP